MSRHRQKKSGAVAPISFKASDQLFVAARKLSNTFLLLVFCLSVCLFVVSIGGITFCAHTVPFLLPFCSFQFGTVLMIGTVIEQYNTAPTLFLYKGTVTKRFYYPSITVPCYGILLVISEPFCSIPLPFLYSSVPFRYFSIVSETKNRRCLVCCLFIRWQSGKTFKSCYEVEALAFAEIEFNLRSEKPIFLRHLVLLDLVKAPSDCRRGFSDF